MNFQDSLSSPCHYWRKIMLVSALTAIIGSPAVAQEAEENEVLRQEKSQQEMFSQLGLEEIIVTGVSSGVLKKRDASFAISTLNSEQIADFAPLHTGDLFNAAPGILAENTGGETGTNTFVRGFAQSSGSGFVTLQLNGLPIYPTSVAGFIENSALFRLDESIERIEALRGGSAVLLSNAQPGVTYNFLQKKGTDDIEGVAKATVTDYGLRRVDLQHSGPINSDTYYSVGGFYRTSPGLRDAEYNGDHGGQAEFQLTHTTETGEVNIWGRHTDDSNSWYLPIPVKIGSDNESVSGFPGFDIGEGTYHGNDNRFGVLEIGPNGETLSVDSKDGRAIKLTVFGASFDDQFDNGWSLSAKTGYTSGSGGLTGPVSGGNPQTLQSFIDDTIAAVNDDAGIIAAAGGPATDVTDLVFSGSGQAITDRSIQVMDVGLWYIDLEFDAFVGDFRFSKEFGNNKFTFGSYISEETYQDQQRLGNGRLMTAESNGKRIDFRLDNGVDVTRNGFISGAFSTRHVTIDTSTWALFALDEWQLSDNLRVEAGLRYEDRNYNGTTEGSAKADLDNDPTTLYNNDASYLNGNFSSLEFDDDATSWTVAANYDFSDAFSTFARASAGLRFPSPNNIVDGQTRTQDIDQYELGFKYSNEQFSLFATVFYNELDNVPFFDIIDEVEVLSSSGSEAKGLELEADWRIGHSFNISFLGTYVDSEMVDGDFDGKQLFRQPKGAVRISPRYEFAVGNMDGAVYGAVTAYLGDRFSDQDNQQPLDSYTEVDLGTFVNLGDQFAIRVSVDNLLDEEALTERNPRTSGAGVNDGLTLGRPIFGRTVQASLEYRY